MRQWPWKWEAWGLTSFIYICCTQSGIRYPVVVRFENQNYAGVTTNNYGLTEVVEAK